MAPSLPILNDESYRKLYRHAFVQNFINRSIEITIIFFFLFLFGFSLIFLFSHYYLFSLDFFLCSFFILIVKQRMVDFSKFSRSRIDSNIV